MDKKSVVLGISIIIGFLILGISIIYTLKNVGETNIVNNNRYEMVAPNDSNIIIFDKQTGKYWRKYIESNAGPTDWTEESTGFLNH